MKYNCTIKNTDALPVPYVRKVGETIVVVHGLYKDKDIFCNVINIGSTPLGQLLVHCTEEDYIFESNSQLEIIPHFEKHQC